MGNSFLTYWSSEEGQAKTRPNIRRRRASYLAPTLITLKAFHKELDKAGIKAPVKAPVLLPDYAPDHVKKDSGSEI